jgi:cobalt/nickel transport protein
MKRCFTRRYAPVWLLAFVGLGLTLLLVFLSPWASKSPDSVEKFVKDNRLESKAVTNQAPVKDYKLAGVSESTSTRISGALGVVVTLLLALAIGVAAVRLGKRRRSAVVGPAPAGQDHDRGGPDEA